MRSRGAVLLGFERVRYTPRIVDLGRMGVGLWRSRSLVGDLARAQQIGRLCGMLHWICWLHSVDTFELEQSWLSEYEFIGASCELRDDL
jgi:hypothetical protein